MAPGLEKTCLFTTVLILMQKIGSATRGNKAGNISVSLRGVLGLTKIFSFFLSLPYIFAFNLAFQIEEWLEG